MTIRFSHPQYLLLLPLVLLFTWWVLRGSLAEMGRARGRLVAAFRAGLLIVIVLALAGIQWVRPTKTLCTVFVVDVSDSIDPGEERVVLQYISDATKRMRNGDYAALVVFGGDALLDHAPEDHGKIIKFLSLRNTSRTRTDIAAGIQLAMASFPPESGKQIVLFSDGNENLGNAVEQAGLALSNDVRISVVPLQRDTTRGEALLLRAEAPQEVKQGAPFQVSLTAEALSETSGKLNLYRNNQLVESRPVRLKPGKNLLTFEQSVTESGLSKYRAILDVPGSQDTITDNNVAYTYTRVSGKPKVLVVEGKTGDGAPLARALRTQSLVVDVGGADRIPGSLAECAMYESIIFANVPAWRMTPMQMAMIRSAVRDTGMGFAMVGGDESFGAGGYFNTPIEDALPVSMDIKKQKTLPSLALVIVIDCSGSMTMSEDGVPKIRLAAEAACAAVEMLQPIDKVCVIGFDDKATYVVKTTRATNKARIYEQIHRLEAGGGGIWALPALKEAYKVLEHEDAQVKHVIMCADAADTEAMPNERVECVRLAGERFRQKMTLSLVGFGTVHDPDVQFHKDMAKAGGGNAYLAERLSNLPQIFTRDVMYAAKSLLIEEPFRPKMHETTHPIMRGIPWESEPALLGYVATSMKESPSASQLLSSHKDDPVLAAWPFGLGRTVAFTSDARDHWAARWLGWGAYPSFWAQTLRWTLRQGAKANFETTIVEEHGQAKIIVEAVTPDGEYRNLLDLRAHVSHVGMGGFSGPKATEETLTLEQTSPGRYEALFNAREIGTYVVTVEERKDTKIKGMQMSTLVIPYSPEYQSVRPNLSLLKQVQQQAQGKYNPPPTDVFGKLRFGARTLRDLWPTLLFLLAVFFLLDIAIRRILLPWSEIFSLTMQAIRRRLPAWNTASAGPAPARTHSATMDGLLGVKEKARRPRQEEGDATTTTVLRNLRQQARDGEFGDTPAPTATMATPSTPPPAEPAAPIISDSTVGSLLQKKRDRGKR